MFPKEPLILDAHTHLPASKEKGSLVRSLQKLINDQQKHGIDACILIPDNVADSPIGTLEHCLKITEKHSNIFLVGTADILHDNLSQAEIRIRELFEQRRIHGFKIFPGHDPIYPTDKRLVQFYKLCARYNKPLIIHTGWNPGDPQAARYNDPKYIVKIAKSFPDMKIIISHYFWPEVEYCYKTTKPYENIFFDTSGLADKEVIEETGYDKIIEVLKKTIEDEPEQLIFGTDYAMCDIKPHLKLIQDLEADETQMRDILYHNAIEIFELDEYLAE